MLRCWGCSIDHEKKACNYLTALTRDVYLASSTILMSSNTLSLRGSETILVAEDEDGVRSLTREVLEKYGYTVLEAANGEEALKVAEQHEGPLDLLLSDVVMPRMGGPELAQALLAKRPSVKVLYMSGYTDHPMVRRGVVNAGVAFLQKPFTPTVLVSRVREVLEAPR
jgi:two-component system, cell cycle sensor histidine kinase and response regulator CckA